MISMKQTMGTDMLNFSDIQPVRDDSPSIKVVGVGGGGGNAINRMIQSGVQGVDFVVANTDLQDLKITCPSEIADWQSMFTGFGGRSKTGNWTQCRVGKY